MTREVLLRENKKLMERYGKKHNKIGKLEFICYNLAFFGDT